MSADIDALHRRAALTIERVGREQPDLFDELAAGKVLQDGVDLAHVNGSLERPTAPVRATADRMEVAV
jgi:hypothetical protein